MTANHNCQTHEHAFHPVGGQADRWDGRDLTGTQSLAVAKPKNCALSFLILPHRELCQDLVELLELKAAAHNIKAVGAGRFSVDLDRFRDRFRLGRSSLCGQRRLEMIVDDIGRNHFQESKNGIFMPRLERAQ